MFRSYLRQTGHPEEARYSPRRPRPLILRRWFLTRETSSRVEMSAWIEGTSSGDPEGGSGTSA